MLIVSYGLNGLDCFTDWTDGWKHCVIISSVDWQAPSNCNIVFACMKIGGLGLIPILQILLRYLDLLQWCFVDEEEYICICENLYRAPSQLFVSYWQESQVEVWCIEFT